MTISLKHNFVSSKSDGVDSSQIQPSNWNDDHQISVLGPSIIGKSDAGVGAATEINIGSGLDLAANTLNVSTAVTLNNATQTLTNKTLGATIIEESGTADALKITNTGTGNSLVIEDEASPDSTPIVVTAGGNLVVGAVTALQGVPGQIESVQQVGAGGGGSSYGLYAISDTLNGNFRFFRKKILDIALSIGDRLGQVLFHGWDGTQYKNATRILSEVDGSVSTNSVPSRLVFETTTIGSTSTAERLRIASDGKTTVSGYAAISNDSNSPALTITNTGTGNSLVIEDSTSPDSTPVVVTAEGQLVIGATAPVTGVGNQVDNVQIIGNTTTTSMSLAIHAINNTGASNIRQYRRTVDGSVLPVNEGLGAHAWLSWDGTQYKNAAKIECYVDGIITSGSIPSRLIFTTVAIGGTIPTERLRIASDGKTTVSGYAAISNDTNNAALTITNTGTGNSLVIEDSTSPDSTPVVVTADGQVIVGATVGEAGISGQIESLEIVGTGAASSSLGVYSTSSTLAANVRQYRKRPLNAPLVDADNLGGNVWLGWDGTAFKNSASISVSVQGAVTTNSIPSRLSFNTTSVGATGSAERFRINNDGKISIYSGLLGPNDTQQHTLPAVTSDTFALLSAPQTLTNKTLDTPVFTGIPVAPTAIAGTNTVQVATTAFVMQALGDVAAALDLINGV